MLSKKNRSFLVILEFCQLKIANRVDEHTVFENIHPTSLVLLNS